jgi:hypothetical protein
MSNVETTLRTLMRAVCRQLEGLTIPTTQVWTVVKPTDAAPYVAMDANRPATRDISMGLGIGLLRTWLSTQL